MRAAVLLVALLALLGGADAMFGGKGSAVQEVNGGKALAKVLKTHKPVMMLLYAPWCGHCKAIHPDWEKLAKAMDGIVKVVAVDCDKHKDVAQQYGVKGFPTIKTLGMVYDKKGKRNPQDYQQDRKFAALKEAAKNLVSSKNVQPMKKFADEHKDQPHVILFTQKTSVPPLFSVVSASPKLKEKYAFFIAKEKGDKKIGDERKVPSWPSIGVFEPGQEPRWMQLEKGVKYKALAEFVRGQVEEDKKEE
eukprot:TRINITY_DN751_c0_g2_i1.p1 TRINITY_DN751_c0_g2~~TRINITY_DN751_c0_g2_i1.p1  ORF type:complete len:248 (+),score=145.01 TRINITY_DN751_c0_g2_i1:67-810(+)